MISHAYYWIFEIAFLSSGIVYAHVRDKHDDFKKRMIFCVLAYVCMCALGNIALYGAANSIFSRLLARVIGLLMMTVFQHVCWDTTWSVALYDSMWSMLSWQLTYELWFGALAPMFVRNTMADMLGLILVFAISHGLIAFTIARWMPDGTAKSIGPRQLISALLIYAVFEIVGLGPIDMEQQRLERQWIVVYLAQLLMAVILYLQNELFKKSTMRQELAVMNMLWKMEQEQYRLSKENIALINQKCHDLKHQIRAIRNASKEDIDKYLEEMEGSIQIYESIVKTGNDVLDTILTEKSLYCRERGITVSCVADGSQMDFINTVDLYAILGNALDNAIEAVQKFKHEEKRQIDVLIHRQQNFLVINIMNPIKGNLTFEEELPVTTKEDKRYHGFGLRSIRYLVKKYDGYLSVGEEDGCFSLKILIPMPT